MDETMSHVSLSVEKREDEIYIPPKQSANTLFRFFKEPDYLFGSIEKKAMIPRYYGENIDYLNIGFHRIAYPMICFCDITVHKLGEHMDLYGKYGIAFSKTWGIQKGIQPLQYVNRNSILCHDFSEAFKTSIMEGKEDSATNFLLTQMYYMKPIEGTMPRDGKNIKKNFTDECEWRYVPNISTIGLPQVVTESDMASIDVLNRTISETDAVWLKFEFNDIKYIILPTNQDFEKICVFLDGVVADESIRRKLISKIIIWDEAKEDF